MSTVRTMICKPFTVFGDAVTAKQIADAIDDLANAPARWMPSDIAGSILPGHPWHEKQEALNRLVQRWRKLGICKFRVGKWELLNGSWELLQLAAADARLDTPA